MSLALLASPALAPLAAQAAPNTAAFSNFVYQGEDPSDAIKAGPGQYRNPVVQGFYPDPSVTRVGKDYYLVNSTFAWFPGLPIHHSTDLVNWTQIGNAIDRPGMLDFKRLGLSRAAFAPAITHHDGLFYILNTCVDCGGNFLITAKDPKGPWSDPVWLPQVGGIDASLFFDDDGRGWIVNNEEPPGPAEYQGHRAIWIQEYDPKTQKTIGPRTVLLDKGVDPSTKPIWPEGPHILKKDGWYYLTAAEGGTAEGHSQVVLRSKAVTGPYVPYEHNPILTQRGLPKDRPLPITSAGHADIVDTPDGQWWATFLAVRPYGDDLYNTGRETFLLPVEWKDGWPVILENGKTIPYVADAPKLPKTPAPPTSGPFEAVETFAGPELPHGWMTMRNSDLALVVGEGRDAERRSARGQDRRSRPALDLGAAPAAHERHRLDDRALHAQGRRRQGGPRGSAERRLLLVRRPGPRRRQDAGARREADGQGRSGRRSRGG